MMNEEDKYILALALLYAVFVVVFAVVILII